MRDKSALLRGFRLRLQRRARRAGLTISPDLCDRLAVYVELLDRWNQRINLTALTDPNGAIDRLLLEPISAARHVSPAARSLLDIGSGGGSPAIPMRLSLPGLALTMVESKARKSAFLREAIRTLGIEGTRVETARYEELLTRPELHEAFDILSLRAVRTDARSLANLEAFLRPGGAMFLFAAEGAEHETANLPPSLTLAADLPLIDSLRSRLLILERRRRR